MSHVQGNAIKEADLLQSFFAKLAKTPIQNDEQAKYILNTAYPEKADVPERYPVQLREEKAERIQSYNDSQEAIKDGIFELFSGAGTQITPDYWGLFNSTSQWFCHVQPSKRPIAESVMFGGRQKNTMKMVNVLAELA